MMKRLEKLTVLVLMFISSLSAMPGTLGIGKRLNYPDLSSSSSGITVVNRAGKNEQEREADLDAYEEHRNSESRREGVAQRFFAEIAAKPRKKVTKERNCLGVVQEDLDETACRLDVVLRESEIMLGELREKLEQTNGASRDLVLDVEPNFVSNLQVSIRQVQHEFFELKDTRKIFEDQAKRLSSMQNRLTLALEKGGDLLDTVSDELLSFDKKRKEVEKSLSKGKERLAEILTNRRNREIEQRGAREREGDRRRYEDDRRSDEEWKAKQVATQEDVARRSDQRFEKLEEDRRLEAQEHERLRTRECQEHGRVQLELGQEKARCDVVGEEEVAWEKINSQKAISNKDQELANQKLEHEEAQRYNDLVRQGEAQGLDRLLLEQKETQTRNAFMDEEDRVWWNVLHLEAENQERLEYERRMILARIEAGRIKEESDLQHKLGKLRHEQIVSQIGQQHRGTINQLDQMTRERDQLIEERDLRLGYHDWQLADRDRQIEDLNRKLRGKESARIQEQRDYAERIAELEKECDDLKAKMVALDICCNALKAKVKEARNAEELHDAEDFFVTNTGVIAAYCIGGPVAALTVGVTEFVSRKISQWLHPRSW